MIDDRIESIIYQSQIYYRNLINSLVSQKRLGKALDLKWEKADIILGYLEALNYRDRLTEEEDILLVNNILECLIKLCELNYYPIAAPLTFQQPPAVLIGIPGQSITGPQGQQGETGYATDFQVSLITVPTSVDYFDVTDSKGVRWDYVAVKSTGEQRAGSILAHWNTDGSAIELVDSSSDDIVGSTSALEFDVVLIGDDIHLLAIPTTGQWTIIGTRYFIPNNGNGTGPISGVLATGHIYIGNLSGVAQARLMAGDVTIDYLGNSSITSNVIVNADINTAAGINVTKLEALSADLLTATNGSGFLTTLSTSTYPSLTEISYVKGVTSSVQTQINEKLTDPMTSIGDIIIRNGSNVTTRLAAGSPNQVLTISGGVPTWQTPVAGFSDPMTTAGDLVHRNSGNVTARLGVGTNGQVLKSNGTVPLWGGVAAGSTSELQKNDGSGSLAGANIFANTVGSTVIATFGSGNNLVNLNAGTNGQFAAIVGTDKTFIIRNPTDTQRLGIYFNTIGGMVSILAGGTVTQSLNLIASFGGGRSLILGANALAYVEDYTSFFNSYSLVHKGWVEDYVDGFVAGGTGILDVSQLTTVQLFATGFANLANVGIGGAWDGINVLSILGDVRQYSGDLLVDSGNIVVANGDVSSDSVTTDGLSVSGITQLAGPLYSDNGIIFAGYSELFRVSTVSFSWNLNSTASITVPHGLTGNKIMSVEGSIRDDSSAAFTPIPFTNSGGTLILRIAGWDATNITLERVGFSGSSYDDGVMTRGTLVIHSRL